MKYLGYLFLRIVDALPTTRKGTGPRTESRSNAWSNQSINWTQDLMVIFPVVPYPRRESILGLEIRVSPLSLQSDLKLASRWCDYATPGHMLYSKQGLVLKHDQLCSYAEETRGEGFVFLYKRCQTCLIIRITPTQGDIVHYQGSIMSTTDRILVSRQQVPWYDTSLGRKARINSTRWILSSLYYTQSLLSCLPSSLQWVPCVPSEQTEKRRCILVVVLSAKKSRKS